MSTDNPASNSYVNMPYAGRTARVEMRRDSFSALVSGGMHDMIRALDIRPTYGRTGQRTSVANENYRP